MMLEKALFILERMRSDWLPLLKDFLESDAGQELNKFLTEDSKSGGFIRPNVMDIFNCFYCTPLNRTKVVILGQDPYPEVGIADGLAFSTKKFYETPKSLKNIFKELKMDLRLDKAQLTNDLESWARQGVLLLNSTLTRGETSHEGKGWETLTKKVLNTLEEDSRPKVFILWGAKAQKLISSPKPHHLYLKSAHPSPLSAYRGFFFQRHFSKANKFLKDSGQNEIDWAAIDARRLGVMGRF